MLTVNHLSVAFDDKTILNDISFQLKEGQIACLLGASGCGKTTILRCIAGFETLKQGSISINNQTVFDANLNIPAHRRQVGMVFQDYALFPHLTVAQNIAFGLRDLAHLKKNQRINEMLCLIDMQDYKNHYPHELSGGQQQRVALVRALAPKPSLILLDEPFSNLDTELRSSLSKEVRRLLKSQGVSAILVTHDQAEAFAMADVIGLISGGKLQQWDSPSQLYHQPKTEAVARFIGEGTLFDIQKIDGQDVFCRLGKISLPNSPTGKKILVRPHDVRPSQDPDAIAVSVIDRDFRSGYWLYTLRTKADDTLLMQISMAANHNSYEIGDSLAVIIKKATTL